MVSREQKRASNLHEKLQLLRSITNSHALNDTSIVADASNYIKELKQKVERLNKDIVTTTTKSSCSSDQNNSRHHKVTVQALERGFLVNAYSGTTSPGLLVSILDAFEDVGLNVLEARVSCADRFLFEAVGGESEENEEHINAQELKRVISETIKNWDGSNEQ